MNSFRSSHLALLLGCSLTLSACGDLNTLLANPQVQAALKSYLSLNLNREVDGTTQAVSADQIKSVSANGKSLTYQVNADGQLEFSDLPADVTALEVQYSDIEEPVMVPIDTSQKQGEKVAMRAVSRFKKGQNGQMAFQENVAGYDFNRDGSFDDSRPQFVYQYSGALMVHDMAKKMVRRFEVRPGQRPDFNQQPREILQGDKFYMPMRPGMQPGMRPGMPPGVRPQPDMPRPQQPGMKPCGPFKPSEDGSLDLPRPDGMARNLKKGEYELTAMGGVKITKQGEPDYGRVVMAPPCGMPPGQPGMQPPPNGYVGPCDASEGCVAPPPPPPNGYVGPCDASEGCIAPPPPPQDGTQAPPPPTPTPAPTDV